MPDDRAWLKRQLSKELRKRNTPRKGSPERPRCIAQRRHGAGQCNANAAANSAYCAYHRHEPRKDSISALLRTRNNGDHIRMVTYGHSCQRCDIPIESPGYCGPCADYARAFGGSTEQPSLHIDGRLGHNDSPTIPGTCERTGGETIEQGEAVPTDRPLPPTDDRTKSR